MKRYLSAVLAAAVIVGLTACGGGATQTSQSSPTATSSPTPSRASRPVPDVTGKSYADARKALTDKGFFVTIVDKDGHKWSTLPDSAALVVTTQPGVGTVTDIGDVEITVNRTEDEQIATVKASQKAAADAAALSVRYDFTCGTDYAKQIHYHSYKDIWTSAYYKSSDRCRVDIDGKDMYDHVPLLPSEQAIVDVVAAHGGDVSLPSGTFGTALLLCAKLDPGYADQQVARMDWKKADAAGALALCPDTPHAAVLQDVINSVKVGDGTHTVGKDMDPGTYRTAPGSKDCYWSRTNGGGNIIANDMVGFAPDGVSVTVYAGEGFESSRCGTWTKVG